MNSAASDHRSPPHLLAIDVEGLRTIQPGPLARLSDRLFAMRDESILVYVGSFGLTGLPEPDYVVDRNGRSIARFPGGEPVAEWQRSEATGGVGAVGDAIDHIAASLLIPASHVYSVGVAAPSTARPDTGVLVTRRDVPLDPDLHRHRPDEDSLIAALEDMQFFGRAGASATDISATAFEHALDTLRRNITDLGFTAASLSDNSLDSHDANYGAVWARDGVITGLWTMCVDDDELIDAFRRTIRVLAKHQLPNGQIPANVRLDGELPDYSGLGGIASIDSVLWFVIGAARLAFHTGDRALAEEMLGPVERAMSWLGAHDANNDGLLEVPESSDWMDLFPRSYNVLYDEVLWWQACIDAAALLDALGHDGRIWRDLAERIGDAIVDQFWPSGEQLMEIAGTQSGRFSPGEASYLLSQITPFDYGWRCDVYANLLAALAGLLDERRLERLFNFLWGVGINSPHPVACLYPPIHSGAEDWKDYFLVNFLNLPDHYHNGGAWPFIGGLWVRFLAATGRVELAHRELAALAEACRQSIRGDEWGFNEWLHGRTGRPMGKAHQAWSAASYVHAYASLHHGVSTAAFPAVDPDAFRD